MTTRTASSTKTKWQDRLKNGTLDLKDLLKPDPDSWAERRFQSLYVFQQDLRCKCYNDEENKYGYKDIGTESIPGTTCSRCVQCKKPTRYSLAEVVRFCEGCEKAYVIERKPDRYGLCSRCASKIPARPKRSGNRVNTG